MSEDDSGSFSTIGDRLKAAREAKKMSLEEIANHTRIPIRHLQHIENEEWDALPAPTYSVGFARSYANAVGLNGNAIGAELRQQIGTTRATYEAPQSYYEPADPARVPPRSLALVAGAIAVLLVAGYILWRTLSVGSVDEAQVVAEETATPVALAQNQPLGGPSLAGATGPVALTAPDEVWFRIYEGGNGALIREGVLRAGERYEVPATAQAPQIRTGRPQALRVTVGSTEIPPLGAPEQTIDNVSLRAADLVAGAQSGAPQPTAAAGVSRAQ
jgi:cytoskeleton protein RodZ